MQIRIDNEIEVWQFQMDLAHVFFESVQANPTLPDDFCAKMHAKYKTLEKIENRLQDAVVNKFMVDGTPDFFIVYENQIAGVFEFHPLSDDNHLEVGFWLYPKYRGKNILTRVFPSMIKYGNQHFPTRSLIATTSVKNESAQGLLVKNGFAKTGLITEVDAETGTRENQFLYQRSLISSLTNS